MSFRILINRLQRKSSMQVNGKGMAVLVSLIFTVGIWGLSTVKRTLSWTPSEPYSGYRLVSIQEVPDAGEICLPAEHDGTDANLFPSFDENNQNGVLALLRGGSVYAASQESGQI